jgi:GNAT superfamily N-acetyltransferase
MRPPDFAALRVADTPADITLARELFVEYARWLNVDLCFQGFDRELAMLPGAYANPRGRLLLPGPRRPRLHRAAPARRDGDAANESAPSGKTRKIGEVKRLYVRDAHRAEGWGRRLAERVIADARVIGYDELKLDTFEWMTDARRLYAKLGFRECAAYYVNPMPGVVYMTRAL